MPASRVILLRHGQTGLNVAGRIQGVMECPLNDVGKAQAREVAPHIAALEPARVLASTLGRAQETARLVAEPLGLNITSDARLIERNYGQWEGKNAEEIYAENPEQYLRWREGKHPEGLGIERVADVGGRMVEAVREAVEDMDGGTLLVVSHGNAIRNCVTVMMGLDPETWSGIRGMDNCHWAMALPRLERPQPWVIAAYNCFESSYASVIGRGVYDTMRSK